MIEILKRPRLKRQIRKGVHSAIPCGAGAFWRFNRPLHDIGHFDKLNPSDSQGHLPSCAGHALANYLEWVLREHGAAPDRPFQLNGKRIWQAALDKTGRKNTGLTRYEVLRGVEGDLLPHNTACRYVSPDNLFDKLQKTPVMLAVNITDQWIFADSKNGFIPLGGVKGEAHAVVLAGVSAVTHSDGPFIHILNSWGARNGVDGIITLDWAEFRRAHIEAWLPEFDHAKWCVDGRWREWLV
jgi:hypothetical protein